MQTEQKIKHFIKKNDWMLEDLDEGTKSRLGKLLEHGWGNGYVALPPNHPLHGVDYMEMDVHVHGRLTFSDHASEVSNWEEMPEGCEGYWIIGFDTCHAGDTPSKWTEKRVMEETLNLIQEIERLTLRMFEIDTANRQAQPTNKAAPKQ